MFSILVAAAFAATPFYQPPPSNMPSHAPSVPHVMHDHRRAERHRRYYGNGYIDSYYDPDIATTDVADDDEEPLRPAVIYRPAAPARQVEQNRTFPTYSEIVVKGAPLGNGCTYKAVMTDDEINACKRAARNEMSQAK